MWMICLQSFLLKVLRSPHPHAMVKRIDTSKAQALQVVTAVLTHENVPNRLMPRGCARALFVLDPHLRHVGDEVAAVAAISEAVAEEALDLIQVDYEILEPVYDPEEAAKPDAPKLYPNGNIFGLPGLIKEGVKEPSVQEWGDINKGFLEADLVVEKEFYCNGQIHSPVEPHIVIAGWEGDDLTIWTATHCPYEVRGGIAFVLGMPENKVRVISPFIGGGFGSKYLNRYQAMAALLSKMSGGKRTKFRFTREEEQVHTKRFMVKQYVKVGAKKDGTLTAMYYKGYADLGGYGNYFGFSSFWGEFPACAYKVPHCRFEGWDVHNNHITSQPCRTVHVPALTFATEQVIDMVAEKLNMDPTEFRINNMVDNGDLVPPTPYTNTTLAYAQAELECYPSMKIIKAVKEKIGWDQKWKGWGIPLSAEGSKRRGISIIYTGYDGGFCDLGQTSMAATMNRDGSVTIFAGTQDLGNSSNTTLCQIAAEYMGIPIEEVSIFTADTNIGQYNYFGARASRELTTGGHLMLVALEEIKQKLRVMASPKLDNVRPEHIEIFGKKAFVKGQSAETGIPITDFNTSSIAAGANGPGELLPLSAPNKKNRNALVAGCEVEVDIETGEVKPLHLVIGHCPGIAINPGVVEAQYQGGAVMALGYALWENIIYDEKSRTYLSDSYTDYRIPRMKDIPDLDTIIIEEQVEAGRSPQDGTPFGAQGVGEIGCWAAPGIIANAIYNATGARVTTLPMTAEAVLAAMKEVEVIK